MRALSSRPFCSYETPRVSLEYLSAGCRYTALLGCRHPVAQGDGHRDDPLSCRDPGDDLLDEVRGRLGHASSGTGRTKATSLATERHQQLFVAGVTTQAEKAMGKNP